MTRPKALTIAGSDSGGGAGIQADLKTFMARGVYGMSVLTAVTAQNTLGVQAVVELAPDFVGQEFDSVLGDIKSHAAKTGMLSSISLVDVVSRKVEEYAVRQLGVDPVMVAGSGDRLVEERVVEKGEYYFGVAGFDRGAVEFVLANSEADMADQALFFQLLQDVEGTTGAQRVGDLGWVVDQDRVEVIDAEGFETLFHTPARGLG